MLERKPTRSAMPAQGAGGSSRRPTQRRAKRYNVIVLASMLAVIGFGIAGLRALEWTGNLPPPPINKWLCYDEKAKFLKEKAELDPTFVTVGSSVTWRNIDLATLRPALGPDARLLNGAPCYLHVNQTFFMARYYAERLPSIRTMMSVFSIRDFERCDPAVTAFFDPAELDRYLFQGWPEELFYFKNLRLSFLQDIANIKMLRSGEGGYNTLAMDEYGSGPVQVDASDHRGVHYGDIQTDPRCFTELRAMASYLAERNIRFVVVMSPTMPAWFEQHDPDGAKTQAFVEQARDSLSGSPAILIDGSELDLDNADFNDAIHLQWSSVPKFSAFIAQRLAAEPNGDVGDGQQEPAPVKRPPA